MLVIAIMKSVGPSGQKAAATMRYNGMTEASKCQLTGMGGCMCRIGRPRGWLCPACVAAGSSAKHHRDELCTPACGHVLKGGKRAAATGDYNHGHHLDPARRTRLKLGVEGMQRNTLETVMGAIVWRRQPAS